MFIYEFILECKENALQNGDVTTYERMLQLLDSLTIEQGSQKIKERIKWIILAKKKLIHFAKK